MVFKKFHSLCFFQLAAVVVIATAVHAALSDHTRQRDNVGHGMPSRLVAAYLFLHGHHSSSVDLVLLTWTSFFFQGPHSSNKDLTLPKRISFFL